MGFFGSLFGGGKLGKELIEAAKAGYTEKVKSLIAKGADVNAKNEKGAIALMLASNKGHTVRVQLLKNAGAKE